MVRDRRPDKSLARRIQERDGIQYREALRRAREILAKLSEIEKQEDAEEHQNRDEVPRAREPEQEDLPGDEPGGRS